MESLQAASAPSHLLPPPPISDHAHAGGPVPDRVWLATGAWTCGGNGTGAACEAPDGTGTNKLDGAEVRGRSDPLAVMSADLAHVGGCQEGSCARHQAADT